MGNHLLPYVVGCLLCCVGSAYIPPTAFRHRSATVLFQAKKPSTKNIPKSADASDPAKKAALDGVLHQIERAYGRGSIVKLGDADHMKVDCVSSGSLTLDVALGGYGFPKGRVVEIYGVSIYTMIVQIYEKFWAELSYLVAGEFWKDHFSPSCHRRGTEAGRYGCVHRRRTCPGSELRRKNRY